MLFSLLAPNVGGSIAMRLPADAEPTARRVSAGGVLTRPALFA